MLLEYLLDSIKIVDVTLFSISESVSFLLIQTLISALSKQELLPLYLLAIKVAFCILGPQTLEGLIPSHL